MSAHRYRETKHGDNYEIRFVEQSDGTWSCYADLHPANPYDASAAKCHLYGSGKICVHDGKEPRTLERAKAIAFLWMEGYSQYVRTGVFPGGRKRVHV